MCKFCDPVFGKTVRKHAENECPLKQASYCCLCGVHGHFVDTCPNKPKVAIPQTFKAEPSVPATKRTRHYWLGDNVDAFLEYLKLHRQDSAASKDGNRELVREHLAKRGYTLRISAKPK